MSGKKPHPFIKIAKDKGIDIKKADWNIERMPHQGGHTKAYYSTVRKKVDEVYTRYQRSGGNWSAERIEKELSDVSSDISEGISSGSIKLYRE